MDAPDRNQGPHHPGKEGEVMALDSLEIGPHCWHIEEARPEDWPIFERRSNGEIRPKFYEAGTPLWVIWRETWSNGMWVVDDDYDPPLFESLEGAKRYLEMLVNFQLRQGEGGTNHKGTA